MPSLTVDGVSIHYQDRGQGMPLLLFHGFPLTGDSFQPQLDALASRYRLIVPDHRGFGRSGVSDDPLEMSRIARDGLAILDSLKILTAVVGGVSMGGYAAMALLRENPGRVRALVLIDTQVTADDEAGKRRREQTAQAVLKDGMQVLVDSMLPKLIAPAAEAKVKSAVEAMIRSNSPRGAAAALRGMALRPDSQDILARYAGPALVVVGEQDAITPPEKAQQIAKLVSGAQLVTIPGAGHLSNFEAPEAFNRALDEFLKPVTLLHPSG